MFFIKWAYKNLVSNKRRTIGMIIFIAIVVIVMIVDLLFLEGTNSQMKESIRNVNGDINIWSSGNLTDVYKYLEKYRPKLENRIRFWQKTGQLIGASGYAEGWIVGTDPGNLKYLDRTVSWNPKYRENLKPGTAVIEADLADKMHVKQGDYITIRIQTETGMINTLQVMVDGIFIGSNLIYGNGLYINLSDQNLLWLTEKGDYFNDIKLCFNNNVSNAELATIQQELASLYPPPLYYVSSEKLYPEASSIFRTFTYYRYMLLFLFALLNLVFIIILYFAIQNIFFMSFRERRQELATLLTYGMKPSWIKKIVIWEAVFIFSISMLVAIIGSVLITGIIHHFQITDASLGELISAIGGPSLCFTINWMSLLTTLGFLGVVTIFSAYKGANTYLKMEVREIISSV